MEQNDGKRVRKKCFESCLPTFSDFKQQHRGQERRAIFAYRLWSYKCKIDLTIYMCCTYHVVFWNLAVHGLAMLPGSTGAGTFKQGDFSFAWPCISTQDPWKPFRAAAVLLVVEDNLLTRCKMPFCFGTYPSPNLTSACNGHWWGWPTVPLPLPIFRHWVYITCANLYQI